MKWYSPKPVHHQQRTLTRLAWFPRRLDDGYIVWLETYKIDQTFLFYKWITELKYSKGSKGFFEVGGRRVGGADGVSDR